MRDELSTRQAVSRTHRDRVVLPDIANTIHLGFLTGRASDGDKNLFQRLM